MATDSDLHCLFTAPVEEQNDSYVIEIPKQEVELGTLAPETLYRIALFQSAAEAPTPRSQSQSGPESQSSSESGPEPQSDSRSDESRREPEFAPSSPPVTEGETRVVEIDNIGDKGDGVARIDGGYVVIVSDADVGERLRVEMDQVRENVAFAEVVERLPYYE
ncbi:TRAM domain-containing protein [Haloarcula sp. CBA1130]|uniref:TRAM domain-containing protein n=1 Tax=unclassified Haloarcula TaxID=2624677 RepID=UPI0012459972|nr:MULTISPECIES: TRAM domain-containing protein [unclassified Haloarcula]KAA9397962.1 TRAM domain-containing protein [Haloarcula sp. CBA1129]KAA9402349.1 TRAM domain-containing protein [Haloarcula sp. CBA1130]